MFKKLGTFGKTSKRPKSEIWVRVEGKKLKNSFNCVWPSFAESRPHVGWTNLVSHEVTFPHVRVYELSGSDSIEFFLTFLEELSSVPATIAIILVNTEESYDLDAKFEPRREDTPVPIVIVKKKTGKSLMKLIEQHMRKIEASIEGEDVSFEIQSSKAEDSLISQWTLYEPKEEVVTNDLEVRVKTAETVTSSHQFKFSLTGAQQPVPKLDWMPLTTFEATYPHVRLYPLKDENGLSFFLDTLSSIPATRALLVVNSTNDYELPAKFYTQECPPIPLLIVTKETGKEVLKLLRGKNQSRSRVEVRVGMSGPERATGIDPPQTVFAGPADRKANETLPQVVRNGLKVKIKSQAPSDYKMYNYVSAPFSSSLRPIDWVDVTMCETTYPHIRLHEVNAEESLSYFMSALASITATMGIIFVNSEDSFVLAETVHVDATQSSPVPVLVMTRREGRELLQLVRENSREVEAKVELTSNSLTASSKSSSVVSRKLPTIVKKGLKLKIKSQSSGQQFEFDYMLAPFCSSLQPVGWTDVTTAEVTYSHIRLHQLKGEDSLGYFMNTMASVPAARAIVLINSDNSYHLNTKTYPEGMVPLTSVLVVTSETGVELQRLVRENLRDVAAKFDLSPSPALSAASSTSSPGVMSTLRQRAPHVVNNGLEIQLSSNKSRLRFDCGCGYFNQATPPSFVDWLPLTQHEVTYQHIRLHELSEDDSLSLFMSTMASIPATLAVVFINVGNNYRLPGKSQPNEQGPPLPVLVVTREVGVKLQGLLRENPRSVDARMATSRNGPRLSFSLSLRQPATPILGLHVRAGTSGTELHFEYVPGPFRQVVPDIDWVALTGSECTYPHVRLHDLKKEDSLSYFMNTMASTPATQAVVFINSDNSLRLPDKFHSNDQSPPVPVLVVTMATGGELQRLLREHPREVEVKIDQLSQGELVERDGLQIKLKKKKENSTMTEHRFDFSWGAFNQTPRDIDWAPLSLKEVTFRHVRLHQLNSTSDNNQLSSLLSALESTPATMAVVLVNSSFGYQLSVGNLLNLNFESPALPVLVVTCKTGRELVKLVGENDRGVEMRVETAFRGHLTPYLLSAPTSPDESLRLSLCNYATGIVKRGMEIKLPNEETHFFDLAWPLFSESPRPLDWMGLARHQVTFPHMQLHELKPGESLSFFLATLGSMASARALLLVNTANTLELDKNLMPQGGGAGGEEGPCVPLLVVTRKTGDALNIFLEQYERDVEVRVHCTLQQSPAVERSLGSGQVQEAASQEMARSSSLQQSAASAQPAKPPPDDWEVIYTPQESLKSGDVPTFSSIVETPSFKAVDCGLKVRSQKKGAAKTHSFDYVWAPFCTTRRHLEWTKLIPSSSSKTTGSHISLHDLKKSKDIMEYNSLLQHPQVKALVLINSCHGYKLPPEFHRPTEIPVLVVTSGTGEALATILRESRGGSSSVEAMVEHEGDGGEDTGSGGGGEPMWSPPVVIEGKLEWEFEGPHIARSKGEMETQQKVELGAGRETVSAAVKNTTEERAGLGREERSDVWTGMEGERDVEVRSKGRHGRKDGEDDQLSSGDEWTLEPRNLVELSEELVGIRDSFHEDPRGCVTEPGEHIPFLLSEGVEWRKPVTNGLQVKPMAVNSTVQFFTYQWSPVTDRPQRMNWIPLTEQTNFPEGHIFVHQLTRKSDIQVIMATLDSGSAAGLLLINSKDSYTVGDRVFPRGEVWTVPILVVTLETGKKIRSVLKSHGCGVEARVEIMSQDSVEDSEPSRSRVSSLLRQFTSRLNHT